ncbi:MAG: thioredoxin family protein, partial [Planctomycetes bacterium]|nr:thioredoxin family protein [Planctomycetota bacterium]
NSTEQEFKEVTEFVKKYKIKKRPLQFMLINSKTGEEVFRVNPTSDDPAVLLKKVYQLLPDKYKGQWIDNFKAAEMIAEKTGRHILINFTGSDWCIWCKRLKQEVFERGGFRKYARKKLVLVEIDFPRKKPLHKKAAAENNALAKKFDIRGYPSVIILNPDGQLVGRTGYVRGGVKEFLAGVKQMMEN